MDITKPVSPNTVVSQLRNEIAKQEAACGCELGAVFALGALMLFIGHLAVNYTNWSATGAVGRGVLWVAGCSLFGKLLGLAWARWRLLQLRGELDRTLTSHWHVPNAEKE
ncbi:hypothetical protein [Knoellia aerolata]|nr:hypothetical protein [Knoellia aerolata]